MQKIASCNRNGRVMSICNINSHRFSTKSASKASSGLGTKILLVMKLTIVLLTVAIMGVSAKGVSQSVTLSGKSISLENVFETIRKQTGYHIFCDLELLKKAPAVDVTAT